eukprot:1915925-Alexandrium_andersonii.AAC.1
MSASLVGSEMCIRDSPKDLMPIDVWQKLPKAAEGWRFKAELIRTVDLPVSYTHLTLPTICSV